MIDTVKRYIKQRLFSSRIIEKSPVEAYDIWAGSYDQQPGNLMLDLDEMVFSQLLNNTSLSAKTVADIGCGTGRHWSKLLQQNPAQLTGFDTSAGMLNRLQAKFPSAKTYHITDDLFADIPGGSFDIIVSTLTVAHIKNIESALEAWCRILKNNGEIIITDFHPNSLAFGGKRTFKHRNNFIAVQNFVHTTAAIKQLLTANNFALIAQEEISIDESTKHYYAAKNALHVYENYKGFPMIYGMHLKRNHDTE